MSLSREFAMGGFGFDGRGGGDLDRRFLLGRVRSAANLHDHSGDGVDEQANEDDERRMNRSLAPTDRTF